MKYCMKCGTLLEDSHNRCIGCGADMSTSDSWSLYPPEMTKTIELEKKNAKSRGGLIIALVAVFVLLVVAITLFIVLNVSKQKSLDTGYSKENVEEVLLESEEAANEADSSTDDAINNELMAPNIGETPETKEADEKDNTSVKDSNSSSREIKDSDGRYYNVGTALDASGEVIFTTIYPEDFSEIACSINYDICSTRYPETITYAVGNDDGNVRMTYMSPQHYWYRKSAVGKSRDNERDIYAYMQFYKYGGAKGYIEAMIKDSYSDIKGFKYIGMDEYSPDVTKVISEVSDNQTKALTGEIGDYARIAEDTVYAAMAAECEANIYHYQATSRQNNTIYMDFYVPVIANTLGYVTEYDNDRGEIIEWLIPEFVAFEAGNEELYDLYADAYKLFIANSKPSERFLYINKAYSDELEKEIESGNMSKSKLKLDKNKVTELNGKYKGGEDLGEYGNGINKLLYTNPSEYVSFKAGESSTITNVTGLENAKVAFYSSEKNKIFISPTADEFPGDEYVEFDK